MSDFIDNTTIIEVEERPMNTISSITDKHDELKNRFEPNQHNSGAITGLSDKLIKIQELKQSQPSKGKGYAEYWRWRTDMTPSDTVGFFVALTQDDNNAYIEPVSDDNYNIFGVTISKDDAAFIGNEEWEPIEDEETHTVVGYESTRDASYGLVCVVGVVKVRYYTNSTEGLDIKIGDYIRPGSNGCAIKTARSDGLYRVVGTGYNDVYGYYVEINLFISASDYNNIRVGYAKSADDYTEDGAIKRDLDNLDDKIENIHNGDAIVGVAKDFDASEGTIKKGFDDIKDGATLVAHANNSDHINITNVEDDIISPYSMKICTTNTLKNMTDPLSDAIYMVTDDTTVDDLVDWKNGVESGSKYIKNATNANYAEYSGYATRSQISDHAAEADHAVEADHVTKVDHAQELAECKEAIYDATNDGFIIQEAGIYVLIGFVGSADTRFDNMNMYRTDIIAIPFTDRMAGGSPILVKQADGTYKSDGHFSNYFSYDYGDIFNPSKYRLKFSADLDIIHYKAIKIASL